MQKPRRQVYNPSVILLLLIAINILGGLLAAQNGTFKHRIDNGSDNRGTSLVEADSGYIMVGWGYSVLYPSIYTKIYKTDFAGNIVAFREYGESNAFWETGDGSVTKTSDGNFVVGGTRSYLNGHDGLVIKFDNNLDTLWTKTIPSSNNIFLSGKRNFG